MHPSHTTTTRPANETEREAMRIRADAYSRNTRSLDAIIVAVISFLPVLLAVSLVVGIARPAGLTTTEIVVRVIAIVATAAFALFIRKRLRGSAAPDPTPHTDELAAGLVEEIEITTDSAVLFHPYDRDGCNTGIAIDIGEGHTLVLFAVLHDETIFEGEEWTPAHDPPEYLRTAAVFPTERFTLVRTPQTGYILSIRTEGTFLRPAVHDLPRLTIDRTNDPESRVIDTPLDDLR